MQHNIPIFGRTITVPRDWECPLWVSSIPRCPGHVRFAPDSDQKADVPACRLRANSDQNARAGVWGRTMDALAAAHDASVQRRVATRYAKLAANYLAFVQLVSIRLWLRVNESAS